MDPVAATEVVSTRGQRRHQPNCNSPAAEPEYSDDARKAHLAGFVMLSIVVNTGGKATISR